MQVTLVEVEVVEVGLVVGLEQEHLVKVLMVQEAQIQIVMVGVGWKRCSCIGFQWWKWT